jgi:pimeloyl-ACP methyl ester carboxylesterase
MYKKILTIVCLITLLIFTSKAQAYIAVPFFNINITEHSVGGDDTFDFHLTAKTPTNPVPYLVDDFSVDTVGGVGNYPYGSVSSRSTVFHLIQYKKDGWQSPIITCSSSDPLVTAQNTTEGVDIYAQGFSSIDCDITNNKVLNRNPVLIVPGVMGTDILKNGEKLWMNFGKNITDLGDNFMDPLMFDSNLKPTDNNLSVGQIITNPVIGYHVYDLLISEFKSQGYTEGTSSSDNLFLFPYDWRYGVSTDTIDKLKQKIDDIRAQTGSDKVDIVAHSTGGLIVKKYVMDNPSSNHIGKAVFVGVPNTGAPKAVKVLLEGDNFSNPFLADSEMKKLAENFPVVYDLSPSQEYYNKKGSYVEVISQPLLFTQTHDLNFEESNNFLINDHNLNSTALDNAHNLHTSFFDNFDMRTAGVDLYSINGCKAGTLGKVIERRNGNFFGTTYEKPKEVPGDGTVPLESATNLPIDSSHKYFALKANHGKMLSQDGIRQDIVNIISGSNMSVSESDVTSDISKCKLNGKAISIYSPLSILVTDQYGNKAGMTEDGAVYNDIPNADFEIMGDHKFTYLPTDEGQQYSIKVSGTDNGTFTLKENDVQENEIIQTASFTNVPVTSSLKGTFDLINNTLSLDTNNDNAVDKILNPSSVVDQDKSLDLVPPQTTYHIDGTQGDSGFYQSSVSFNLEANDVSLPGKEEQTSGVLNTNVNIDDAGYMLYAGPILFTQEGQHSIEFFSTDRAGNNEVPTSIHFTVDKTTPEVNIKFDPSKKDLVFNPSDNISKPSNVIVSDKDDLITFKDQAGNTTLLKLKDKDRKNSLRSEIKDILYNNRSVYSNKNEFNVEWKFEKNGTLKSLKQHLKNKKDFAVDANYENNITIITGKDKNGKINKKLNGLIILNMSTNKGDLDWSY